MRKAPRGLKNRGRSKLQNKKEMRDALDRLRPERDAVPQLSIDGHNIRHLQHKKRRVIDKPLIPMHPQDTQKTIHSFLSPNALRSYSLASKRANQITKRIIRAERVWRFSYLRTIKPLRTAHPYWRYKYPPKSRQSDINHSQFG